MWIVKVGESYLTYLEEEELGRYYCETTVVSNDKNINIYKDKENAEYDANIVGGTVVSTTEDLNEKQKAIYKSLWETYRKNIHPNIHDIVSFTIYEILTSIYDFPIEDTVDYTDFTYKSLTEDGQDDTDFIPALEAFLREVKA